MKPLGNTSEIAFESSAHGLQRRTQRNISVRDLQAAVKYGVKERGYPHPRTGEARWRYTYMDVVYITDSSSTVEITSWALSLPLSTVALTPRMIGQLEEARVRLADYRVITSHTVLVVDQSASMRKSDMNGHRTRSRAVYYELAEEFLAPRLRPLSSQNPFSDNVTDVVTLIEMREEPTLVFSGEPVSWDLYNRFVRLADKRIDEIKLHGNYKPSIQLALDILLRHVDEKQCALLLFFLTDGRPSDMATSHIRGHNPLVDMMKTLKSVAQLIPDRFEFHAIGFGSDGETFDVLRDMVSTVQSVGAPSYMVIGNSDELHTALTSVVHSTTSLVSKLSSLNFGASLESHRIRTPATKISTYDPKSIVEPRKWNIFNTVQCDSLQIKRMVLQYERESRSGYWIGEWKDVTPFQNATAVGFAVAKEYFGEGAERIVYDMREIDKNSQPVGPPLVFKHSRWLQKGQHEKTKFHKIFVRTQMKAESIAKQFNSRLDRLGISLYTPRIVFISCSIYQYEMINTVSGINTFTEETFLAEQKLDATRYKKWNDNAGGVDGVRIERNDPYELAIIEEHNNTPRTAASLPVPSVAALDAVQEEEEEEDEDDENDEDLNVTTAQPNVVPNKRECQIMESDVPQAFTHFSYVFSKRNLMVCDLQGVLSYSGTYPVFQCTDPCIHRKDTGRGNLKYGRTNKGKDGIRNFFKTHKCNVLCEELMLHNNNT